MNAWISASLATIDSHRRLIDGALQQISDEELCRRPAGGINSIAVILRHIGGNLLSRWTDFLNDRRRKTNSQSRQRIRRLAGRP